MRAHMMIFILIWVLQWRGKKEVVDIIFQCQYNAHDGCGKSNKMNEGRFYPVRRRLPFRTLAQRAEDRNKRTKQIATDKKLVSSQPERVHPWKLMSANSSDYFQREEKTSSFGKPDQLASIYFIFFFGNKKFCFVKIKIKMYGNSFDGCNCI